MRDHQNLQKDDVVKKTGELTGFDWDLMIDLLDHHPESYLGNLEDYQKKTAYCQTGVRVSLEDTAKKIKDNLLFQICAPPIHPDQDPCMRKKFLDEIKELKPEMLVFLDECDIILRSRDRNFETVSAINKGGVLAMKTRKGCFIPPKFERFVEERLFPRMQSYPNPDSVLVMNKTTLHRSSKIAEEAAKKGIRILYLPAFAADLNPITRAFGILTEYLRRSERLRTAENNNQKMKIIEDMTREVFSRSLISKSFAATGLYC